MRPTFDVDVTAHPGRTVVCVTGDLDMDTCPHLAGALEALTLRGQVLALGLSAMTFMDSSALNLLLALRTRAQAEGAVLELHEVPERGLRLFDITGARDLFTLCHLPHPTDAAVSSAVSRLPLQGPARTAGHQPGSHRHAGA
ncbi:STAS domain-containing protein [Streptomyces sp. NPDC001581]|uniref:STAS domain-containing protein n=1 Tax=Streptomyces sp. NPDC001581 TaxID=3154386 RepID=UPI00332BE0DD